ncbi:MAG: hypothetical protein EA369_00875 [Bradymonadales bacterium]|nr:MAG: hypothetical protein EA369_00875 [Bradymonadales bacterium]
MRFHLIFCLVGVASSSLDLDLEPELKEVRRAVSRSDDFSQQIHNLKGPLAVISLGLNLLQKTLESEGVSSAKTLKLVSELQDRASLLNQRIDEHFEGRETEVPD